MQKSKLGAIIAGAVVLFSGAAMAGYKAAYPVTVMTNADNSGIAFGSMGTARNSSDAVQYIGCSTQSSFSPVTGTCFAKNAAGKYLQCVTTDPTIVSVISSVAKSSFISFSASPTGACYYVNVTNNSYFEPEK